MKFTNFGNLEVYCINLKQRKDRKLQFKREAKKKGILAKFFNATHDPINPSLGKLKSHINLIKLAKKLKLQHILVLEDDIQILSNQFYLHYQLPKKWDILYLGGSPIGPLTNGQRSQQNINNNEIVQFWNKSKCILTHAYILHSSAYDTVIRNAHKYDTIDETFYHTLNESYISNPPYVIQRSGYSDIVGKDINYNYHMRKTIDENGKMVILQPDGLDSVQTEIDDNGACTLKLPDITNDDLPGVTIITPTYNRRDIFPLAVRNFYRLQYPKDKLEWLIADDGTDKIKDLLPGDERIRYINCKVGDSKLTIPKKRNILCKYATYNIIAHMDDDDLHFPTSILARVKALKSQPDKKCVGCHTMGIYDMANKQSNVSSLMDENHNLTELWEGSMMYTKDFWLKRPFNDKLRFNEGVEFIDGRYKEVITLPYQFMMNALLFEDNINLGNKVLHKLDKSLFVSWDENTKMFIEVLDKSIN